MAIFEIVYRNALNPEGEPCEFPADKLNANGARIDSYGIVKREIRPGDNFARELWEYEIPDKDADRFAEGLKTTPTMIEYKRK